MKFCNISGEKRSRKQFDQSKSIVVAEKMSADVNKKYIGVRKENIHGGTENIRRVNSVLDRKENGEFKTEKNYGALNRKYDIERNLSPPLALSSDNGGLKSVFCFKESKDE